VDLASLVAVDLASLGAMDLWLRWEQAGSSGSSIAGRGESGFAGSKLVAVDLASLVVVKVASLGATW